MKKEDSFDFSKKIENESKEESLPDSAISAFRLCLVINLFLLLFFIMSLVFK